MITVVLRYDDFSARSDSCLEKRLLDLFKRFQVPCVFGVVPFVCDKDERDPREQGYCELPADKIELLRDGVEAGLIEPALHGYHHQNCNLEAGGRLHEFSGLPRAEQLHRVSTGKEWLERISGGSVVTFIPPFNAYDLNTLSALELSGFRVLSAAMFDAVGRSGQMAFMPHTCSIVQVRDAVIRARELPGPGVAVIPLFHPFDFVESDRLKGRIDLDRFGELLTWLVEQPDIEIKTFSALPGFAYDAPRFSANRSYLRLALHPLALPWWSNRYPRTQYLTRALARSFSSSMVWSAAGVFAGIVVASLMVGTVLSSTAAAMPIRIAALLAMVAVTLFWLVRRRRIYFRAFALMLSLSGVAIGTLL